MVAPGGLFGAIETGVVARHMAEAFAEQTKRNLLSGLAPDGRPMPTRLDGRPRGVRTGQLANSLTYRLVGSGFRIVATGARAAQGAVARVFYGMYKQRAIGRDWKAEAVVVTQAVWRQPLIAESLKNLLRVLLKPKA